MDALLGTDTDWNIARRLGCYGENVGARRKALGIPGYRPPVRKWTPAEEKLLGTDTLVNIAARLGRPTSQIQKRMKERSIPPFLPRVRPRNPAKIAEEKALAERGKARTKRQLENGMAASVLVAAGSTLAQAGEGEGISGSSVGRRLGKFHRLIFHPLRLGQHVPPPAPMQLYEMERSVPGILSEVARRMKIEFETGDLDVWREPLPV
jgi:hypothetical protein